MLLRLRDQLPEGLDRFNEGDEWLTNARFGSRQDQSEARRSEHWISDLCSLERMWSGLERS